MTVASSLYTLVKSQIGAETLIFADQNAPRPTIPYWTMRLASQRLIGRDSYSNEIDNSGNQKVRGVREITVNVQRIGEDSSSFVGDLRDNLSKTTVLEAFQIEKLALYDTTDVLNVPFKMDESSLEPRASMDLLVRFGSELLDNVGIIDTVDIAAQYVTNQTLGFTSLNVDLAETITVIL